MLHVRRPVRIGLAIVLVVAGVGHFRSPRPFIEHLPEVVPMRAQLVTLTGAVELMLAAGLMGPRRWQRAFGLAVAAYLALVFPANLYAALTQVPIEGVPSGWIRWARLPLQIPLIVAALWSTRPGRTEVAERQVGSGADRTLRRL